LRRKKQWIEATGIILVAVFSVMMALAFSPPRQPKAAAMPEDPGPASVAFQQNPDLDGDGRADTIQTGEDGIKVTSGAGRTLLWTQTAALGKIQVATLGGSYPVLFAKTASGEYAAFTFDPAQQSLQLMRWPDGRMRGVGELTSEGALRQAVVSSTTARQRVLFLQAAQGRLMALRTTYEPLTTGRRTPAEALATAVEAVGLGLKSEMGLYFATDALGSAFFNTWHEKLPPGSVQVAQADQMNAGGESGHTVPFTVWVAGTTTMAALKGEARFRNQAGRVQIEEIKAAGVPLKVTSWEAAARLLPQETGLRKIEAPFYGQYRFEAGTRRFVVDAISGKVEPE
jgi:hypothetical protein